MAEQQRQRFFVTANLMQLQRELSGQRGVFWMLFNLLLQLLNFRRIGRLFQQLNLDRKSVV